MEIVISGYYGFDNVGDEAILLSIIQAIRKDFPNIAITVLSNQPEVTAEQYNVNAVNRWSLKEVIEAIKYSDGVISGGGGLLQDKTGNASVSYYCGIMWIAKFFKKPFFVYAQGIGPIQRTINKKIVTATLKRAALITVRDEHSKKYIEELGLKKDIFVVPDPVLGMNLEEMKGSSGLEEKLPSSSFIVVTVRYWNNGVNYIERIAEGLEAIALKGKKIVFIPMHGIEDYHCSVEVKSKIRKDVQDCIYVAPHQLSIQEKASIIGKSELLIGMRLHSLIFAAIKLIPFISISYDPKVDIFTELCGQKIVGNVEHNTWDSATLIREADECLSSNDLLKENILHYMNDATKQAEFTAVKVVKKLLIQKVNERFSI